LIATFDKAFHRFNKTRSELLVLYPGTAACLQGLHERGVFVVGHTEASAVNARFRLTKLGVARYFTRLYAREPVTQDQEHLTHWTDANGSLDVAHLPRNEVKPNPRVLRDICRGMGTAPRQTLYVGDSLVRDVGMAKEAGVYAAWAKYGTRFDAGLWNQLVRVTHWTSEDFDRTRMANQRYAGVEPDVILHDQFSEILDHFEFDAVPSHASDAHG
jgi:phosphoglycolate phosphatase-like HAD superfamily hydrolase